MRFNVLFHETRAGSERPSHWDLLVEAGVVLWTWAIEQRPDTLSPQPATRLPDHRPLYLDYEGPLSNDRGHVSRWDCGKCAIEANTPERLILDLRGGKLQGRLALTLRDAAHNVWDWEFASSVS